MTATHTIRESRNVVRRPHAGQFFLQKGITVHDPPKRQHAGDHCDAGKHAEQLHFTPAALSLLLALLYRFACLRRIRYRIDAEQLVCEHGLLRHKVDYMELYRIVDFEEYQNLLQQLCGLKTVRILSTDRNMPRLDLTGMRRGDDIVPLIRERVEQNKREKGIYEITNH